VPSHRKDFIDHYSESDVKLGAYDLMQLEPLLRSTVLGNKADILSTRDILLSGVELTPQIVDEVTEFMKALTDPAARNLGHLVPMRVPSGLPIDGPRQGAQN
jgi:cytochrome c peroxidase